MRPVLRLQGWHVSDTADSCRGVRLCSAGARWFRASRPDTDILVASPGKTIHEGCGRWSARHKGLAMYAVIRTGGKQYKVSPGDTFKIERTEQEKGAIEFADVLAVSSEEGKFEADLAGAKVTGTVLGEGRFDKILVFKMKRKKQYKKMQGHRQGFVEVAINEIVVNGKSYKAEAAAK